MVVCQTNAQRPGFRAGGPLSKIAGSERVSPRPAHSAHDEPLAQENRQTQPWPQGPRCRGVVFSSCRAAKSQESHVEGRAFEIYVVG